MTFDDDLAEHLCVQQNLVYLSNSRIEIDLSTVSRQSSLQRPNPASMPPNASSASLLNALAGQSHLPVTQLFHKGEVVGKGAYGSVHRGIHIGSGAVVALKIINLDIADDDVEAIQKEVALLSQLRGGETTNVTQYYGCWLDGPRVWIVMDFASGGSVRTLVSTEFMSAKRHAERLSR